MKLNSHLRSLSKLPRIVFLICALVVLIPSIPALLLFQGAAKIAEAETTTNANSIQKRFAIYYGWYAETNGVVGRSLDRIVESHPEIVISPMHTSTGSLNLTPEIIKRFHDNEIKVVIYIATNNANRDLDKVLEEIDEGLEAGADGIMLDEVSVLQSQSHVNYYSKIYTHAKSFGSDIVVIANPGTVLVSEEVMKVSDILSFEHQWRLAPNLDWFSKYPPSRYMGISSNDIENVMGYTVDKKSSLADTVEAWQSGIGYHFSTDAYTKLPSWYEEYQSSLDDYLENSSNVELHELKVRTVDKDNGQEIKGLWIEVKHEGRVIRTGFSPALFMLSPDMYEVSASSYQNFVFSNWHDGTSVRSRTITIDSSSEIVAAYKNQLATLSLEAVENNGNAINGIHVSINSGETVISDGYTPLKLDLLPGTYIVTTSAHQQDYVFSKWNDGSVSTSKQVVLSGDTLLSARYNSTRQQAVGISMECQDVNDYRMKIAESLKELGPLGGILELSRQHAMMRMQCGNGIAG